MELNLVTELRKSFNGDAWHGDSVMDIVDRVDASLAFRRPIANAHSIAEIILHLTGWTNEVLDRLKGGSAKEPINGDWPKPQTADELEWKSIVNNFSLANEQLLNHILNIGDDIWLKDVVDERNPALGTGVSYRELVNGLIQHHAYHAGQISLLLKFEA